ncbi:MAG: PQQ-dependent sugar dehydrogenase [Saprospirales bacterium]|nr:PQQ-dependent sugar dehydrogenase [Saprospirales bacterium]MBK8923498.1 PQQ-dependent sugar dehydrogenase [Saprospirales bacterium]
MRLLLLLLLALAQVFCTTPGPPKQTAADPEPASSSVAPAYSGSLPLDKIVLPPGFRIGTFAENVRNARSLCLSPGGTLFVGTREAGDVYALRDTNNDRVADLRYTLATGLRMPNGVAFRNGSLYVAEVNRILRFDDIENRLANPPKPVVVYDQYPTEEHHGWKYIAFGPDGKLYVPVGAPCNVCERENPIYASITRLDVDHPARGPEVVQNGVRNTVGFTWHPQTGELWFTDNGRDMLGEDIPACELNHAVREGMHFGFPYCHQGDLKDPKFGDQRPCAGFTPPAQKLGPHVAPLGLEFGRSAVWPAEYNNQILIAEHGSWNRTQKTGYRLSLIRLDAQGRCIAYEPFASGWLQAGDEVWGRPVDLEWLPDGSLLVSDDFADAVYRIYWDGGQPAPKPRG